MKTRSSACDKVGGEEQVLVDHGYLNPNGAYDYSLRIRPDVRRGPIAKTLNVESLAFQRAVLGECDTVQPDTDSSGKI